MPHFGLYGKDGLTLSSSNGQSAIPEASPKVEVPARNVPLELRPPEGNLFELSPIPEWALYWPV